MVLGKVPEDERIILAGDLNGHIRGRTREEGRVHGGWSFGVRNAEGDSIVEHALVFDLAIGNTISKRKENS